MMTILEIYKTYVKRLREVLAEMKQVSKAAACERIDELLQLDAGLKNTYCRTPWHDPNYDKMETFRTETQPLIHEAEDFYRELLFYKRQQKL